MSVRGPIAALGLLAVVGAFTVAWNLGGPAVSDLMEVRNLITAREMSDTGRWLIPTMNGSVRLEKPPLPTWAAAGAGLGAGFRNLWALRAPTFLIGLLGAMAVVLYARRLGASPPCAVAAGLVLLSMFLYAKHARVATWDVPTHALAMAGIAAFVEASRRRSMVLGAVSGLCIAASSMSKGPMLAVMVVPWLAGTVVWDRTILGGFRRAMPAAIVAAAAGAMAWPLYVYWHEPGLAVAVALQESDAWITRHVHPLWYYAGFPIFTGAWIPTALAVLLSPLWFREFSSRPRVRATLAWLWLSLLVLSVVPTKKERYLIPVLFPFAVLIGLWWESEGRRGLSAAVRVMRAQMWFAGIAGVAALAAVFALLLSGRCGPTEAVIAACLVALGLGSCLAVCRSSAALPTRAGAGTLLVAAGVMAAGWQLQDRLEPRALPPVGLADAGRIGGALDAPYFAHAPDDLYLVWAVGRPLLPFPDSPERLVEAASAAGRESATSGGQPGRPATVLAGWVSPEPPGTDRALQRLREQHVTVDVEQLSSGEGVGGGRLFWSRLRLSVPESSGRAGISAGSPRKPRPLP